MGLKINTLDINGVEYDLTSSGSSDIDVIDNLETADSQSALSANQGKILNEKITELEEDINNIGTGGSDVSVEQILTSGTKVGTITVDGISTDLYAPENTDTTYSVATTSEDGLMSAEDKKKLDEIDFNSIVDNSVTVNGQPLSSNIELSALDVGADASGSASKALSDANAYTDTKIADKVDNTITVNGKPLSANVTLSASDVGADASGAAQTALSDAVAYTDSKVATLVDNTTTINGKALTSNIMLAAADVGADATGEANSALAQAKQYTDTKIGELIDSAPETMNTLNELAEAISEHQEVTDALNSAIGSKANASDLTSHTGNTTAHITATERTNWNNASTNSHTHSNKAVLDATTASYTTALNTKLGGIAAGAEVNQNAFSNVVVGGTTIAADAKTDTLTLAAGSNVTITPDATNDKITIAATDTTYSAATQSAQGLMSAADKKKLDGVAEGANKYTHPSYTAKSSGLYKVTVDASGHVSGTSAVAKADITGLGIPAQDTTYSNFVKSGSGAKAGLVPAPSTTAGTTKYLREDGTWTAPPNSSAATQSAAGLMSAADKTKLDGIATGATKITVDTALSSTSTNPVQNKVINSALAGKSGTGHTHSSVLDAGDGRAITFAYSKDGMSTTSWLASWNGAQLEAISPANALKAAGGLSTAGGTISGDLAITKDLRVADNYGIEDQKGNGLLYRNTNATTLGSIISKTPVYVGTVDGNDVTYIRGANVIIGATSHAYTTRTIAVASDQRVKNNESLISEEIDKYVNFFDKLQPRKYNYTRDEEGVSKSIGFFAQEVHQALLDSGLELEDFGGVNIQDAFVEGWGEGTDEAIWYEDFYSLSYEQFIPIIVSKIQHMEQQYNNKLRALEEDYNNKLASLEERLKKLEEV